MLVLIVHVSACMCTHLMASKQVIFTASSACTHGQVRLTGGDVSTEGNVEICNNGQWNGVCNDGFNYLAAIVVCAQLGLPSSSESMKHFYL